MSRSKKMIRRIRILCQGMTIIFLAGLWQPVMATGKDAKDAKRERQALRRMQQQLSEIQQQKSAVEQEKMALEEALKKNQGEVESQKRAAAGVAVKVSRLEKDIELANSEKAGLRTQLEEAAKRNEELSGQRKQLEADLKNTASALAKQSEQRKLCEANNAELYRIGRDLVGWYSAKGPLNAILEAEPFTRMKSVEMENLLENYRDKLESQHLEKVSP
ncbi:MAG: DNA repair protein [Betaproteobacteria bacterium]|nr:DNA repair protein [Betaproteobacteria bacterium]